MFQLPISTRRFPSVINFLLTKCHETWTGDTSYSPAWAWASSIGPGIEQCDDPAQWHSYGRTVLERAVNHPFGDWDERIRYYKEGLLTRDWTLRGEFSNYALPSARDHEPQDLRKLQCSASILFGTKDLALHYKICTEGWEACVQESRFPDTKAFDSQLVLIEDCGHWSPLEKAGRDRIREHLLRLVAPPESIYS